MMFELHAWNKVGEDWDEANSGGEWGCGQDYNIGVRQTSGVQTLPQTIQTQPKKNKNRLVEIGATSSRCALYSYFSWVGNKSSTYAVITPIQTSPDVSRCMVIVNDDRQRHFCRNPSRAVNVARLNRGDGEAVWLTGAR